MYQLEIFRWVAVWVGGQMKTISTYFVSFNQWKVIHYYVPSVLSTWILSWEVMLSEEGILEIKTAVNVNTTKVDHI